MQLNEIGSRHGSNTHHVTSCMHDHSHINKVGKVGAAPSGVSVQSAMAAESQADAQFSLAEWLDKTLNGGRGFGAASGATLTGSMMPEGQPRRPGDPAVRAGRSRLQPFCRRRIPGAASRSCTRRRLLRRLQRCGSLRKYTARIIFPRGRSQVKDRGICGGCGLSLRVWRNSLQGDLPGSQSVPGPGSCPRSDRNVRKRSCPGRGSPAGMSWC